MPNHESEITSDAKIRLIWDSRIFGAQFQVKARVFTLSFSTTTKATATATNVRLFFDTQYTLVNAVLGSDGGGGGGVSSADECK